MRHVLAVLGVKHLQGDDVSGFVLKGPAEKPNDF